MQPNFAKLFRVLLLAELAIGALSTAAEYFEPQLLPADLKPHATDMTSDAPIYIAVLVAIEAVLVAGLWHYKRWARFLLTAVAILSFVGSLVEPSVLSGLSAALTYAEFALLGALLVMAWAVLPDRFARTPPEPNA